MSSVTVRQQLLDALRLDLIGPTNDGPLASETLPKTRPESWYLTGFLVPTDAGDDQKYDAESDDTADAGGEPGNGDDATTPEPASARRAFLPSSMGMSLLASAGKQTWNVTVRWGDYKKGLDDKWTRTPRTETLPVPLPQTATSKPKSILVPNSGGLKLVLSVKPVNTDDMPGGLLAKGTRAVSIFLVNERTPKPDELRDEAFAFQAELEVKTTEALIPRPNPRGLNSDDRDERVNDLLYRNDFEYAVGHGVSTQAHCGPDAKCCTVKTEWIPDASVEHVAASKIDGVELKMEVLATLKDGTDAQQKIGTLASQYKTWIEAQYNAATMHLQQRQDVVDDLINRAKVAARRIDEGVKLLGEPQALEAFRMANKCMAMQARQRFGPQAGKKAEDVDPPAWRPFQLAFLLMNLPSIANPLHDDRSTVDLLFFPTGGGKTEAYLGLAAFTLILRRLKNPGIASAGLSVLMRYTLRLLTLDQLGRAATLICALELERQKDVEKLGEWPFEIGLWVGQAATPNRMGKKGDNNSYSARSRTIAFQNDDRKPAPIPLENCPWCGTKFKNQSFQLIPNPEQPTDLRVRCANRKCEFTGNRNLPILAVDEPIYRRLPCFLIATVDKFAAMPWTGEVGGFFGKVERNDKHGFYGPCQTSCGTPLPGPLAPPDLVIQDELHLISGPMGTMVGLYETALDALCEQVIGGKKVRPKIVASTATVRRAETQIKALFNRGVVDIFPPPCPDRRNTFFARTHSTAESNARLYVGVAAQGRSPKRVMLRTFLALMGAAQKAYEANGGNKNDKNSADPYMTLLGYYNSLRELGGSRRIVEDEVSTSLTGFANRKRVGETVGSFANRRIDYEVMELTSRVSTDKVSDAKRRLALPFFEKDRVDVALATNMISVGLDITRLGLMVVYGQPKTSAEYIQATSRVGRDKEKPGLVVTILNIHKPRDRSHYERFDAYHQSFYRSVEATSVTPFSPRALDRGLAAVTVALARLGHRPMTAPKGAGAILSERGNLDFVVDELMRRAEANEKPDLKGLKERVRDRASKLLDDWEKIAHELQQSNAQLQYQEEAGSAQRLLYDFLDTELKKKPAIYQEFRANRSMRDVEPSVNLWLRTLDNIEIETEAGE